MTAEVIPPPGAPPGWAPPVNRVGFQGLFLEPGVYNASNAGLSASSMSLWCARNRFILSSIGRWLTRDPAEAALPIITALAFNGGLAAETATLPFSPTGHYADGFNLYEFAGSNPVNRCDPLGLQWGLDEDIDDIIAQMGAERAAAAHHAFETIGNMAQSAAIGALQATLATLFPPYGLYLSVRGVAFALEDMMYNGPTWQNTALFGLSAFGMYGSFGASAAQVNRVTGAIRAGYRRLGGQYAKSGLSRSGFAEFRPAGRTYTFWRGKRGSGQAGCKLSWDDAIDEIRYGGDVVAGNKSAARELAELAGNGPPVWDAPHGPGQLPHYHPTSGGQRMGGHVFY